MAKLKGWQALAIVSVGVAGSIAQNYNSVARSIEQLQINLMGEFAKVKCKHIECDTTPVHRSSSNNTNFIEANPKLG